MHQQIQLIKGNSLAGMRTYPDKFFDIGILDMPYGIGEHGTKSKSRERIITQSSGSKIAVVPKNYTVKKWDKKPPSQVFFNEAFRVCKYLIIWGENYMKFRQRSESSGRIIWDKVNGDSDYSDCEIAWTNLITSTRQIEYMWSGFNQGKSIKEGRVHQGNKKLNEVRLHPTHKPSLLYRWLLQQFAKPGYKIFDPGFGSGSLAIACMDMGLEFVGYEKDREYFNLARNWVDNYTANKEINQEINFEQLEVFA